MDLWITWNAWRSGRKKPPPTKMDGYAAFISKQAKSKKFKKNFGDSFFAGEIRHLPLSEEIKNMCHGDDVIVGVNVTSITREFESDTMKGMYGVETYDDALKAIEQKISTNTRVKFKK